MTTKTAPTDKGDVEITEMTEIKASRYDGVKSAASGYPILMLKATGEPEGASPEGETGKAAEDDKPPAVEPAEPVKEDKEDGAYKELLDRLEAVEKAKTEAEATSVKRIEALEAQLAKVLDTPIPGGPVITVPTAARKSREDETRQVEAARMRRLADGVDDPDLKKFYKERARELSGKEE